MEHEQSRENYVEPAIILTGDFLRDATDERRLQIAASLAELLGGNAIVQEVDLANLAALAETAVPAPESVDGTANASAVDEASTEGLRLDAEYPPFTLLLYNKDKYEYGRTVRNLQERAPGVAASSLHMMSRALKCANLAGAGSLFTYPEAPGNYRTITFKQPRSIVEQPEFLYHLRNMGPGAAAALGDVVKLATTPVDLTAGQ